MDIKCPSCSKDLRIPDEKLPAAPRFKIRCPQCAGEITVDRGQPAPQAQPAPQFQPQSQAPVPASAPAPSSIGSEAPAAMEPEIFPPGARTVFLLLRDGEWRETAKKFFTDRGVYESTAASAGEAIQKLRLNSYDTVVLEDAPENISVLSEIAGWPGHKRRSVNLVVIGDRAGSLDPKAGFLMGVNTYLARTDAPRAQELLASAMKEYEDYYLPFTMAAAAGENR